MELEQEIELVEAMIKEDQDYTIKDFIELKKEIESIEETQIYAKSKSLRA